MDSIYRHIMFCSIALLFLPLAAHAEPSKAFLKCEKWLNGKADRHREQADKLRRKNDAKIEKIVRRAMDKSSGEHSSADELRASAERIRKWHRIEQFYSNYVDDAIESSTLSLSDDVPGFKCQNLGFVAAIYKQKLDTYELALKLFKEGVEERIKLEDRHDSEGLVVVAFNSNQSRLRVLINRRDTVGGNIQFEPIGYGEHFRVFRAKAGTYNWDEITQKRYESRYLYDLSRFDLSFKVEAGKLNYAGVFMFNVNSGLFYSASLNDRLIITLTVLEQRYPELIRQYEIANGLSPDDRFTQFYLREKGLISSEAESESHE